MISLDLVQRLPVYIRNIIENSVGSKSYGATIMLSKFIDIDPSFKPEYIISAQ